jgi:hypothetical protein
MKKTTPESFLQKIDRSSGSLGCWVYRGSLANTGYGRSVYCGKRWQAHRLAWHLLVGAIPEKKYVLHKCDNPPCCNPAHLWLGTQEDNMKDCSRKNRARNGHVKLSEKQVLEMIALRKTKKLTYEKIGAAFGVHNSTAHLAIKGRTWKHLKRSKK